MPNQAKRVHQLSHFVAHLFELKEDTDELATLTRIKSAINFTGSNLWILVMAVLIASIGLNTNSTAVIIGAMLISPLMGPIMGIGLGLGINDLELIRRSLRNLSVAVLISLITSGLYFWATPLQDAQSELLARTHPTIYDVLIAIFGGISGVIAISRRETGNAIPGVAIATALMPPLCTAGYGIATGQWGFFLGAFYLFFINSLFICLSTFVMIRLMKFEKVHFVDPEREKRVGRNIAWLAFLTILPSIYAAWEAVDQSVFENRARRYIAEVFQFEHTQVLKSHLQYDRSQPSIELVLIGQTIKKDEQKKLIEKTALYDLDRVKIEIKQTQNINQQDVDQINQTVKNQIVEEIYKNNTQLLSEKAKEIESLNQKLRQSQTELKQSQFLNSVSQDLADELQIQYPQIQSFSLNKIRTLTLSPRKESQQTVFHVSWKYPVSTKIQQQLQNWLRIRLKEPSLLVQTKP